MSAETTTVTSIAQSRMRFELAYAALAILALTVAFLWTPITRFGDSTYSPVDFMQRLPLTQVDAEWHPGNRMVSDVAVEYHPWYLFDRDELARGRLPVWNRLNGYGVPHLANFQSAVFSPLTAFFYVFPFKLAVLLAAFAKLFALGFFTYLFLRKLRLAPIACLFGAAVYMFSGHNVLRLGYAQSAVAIMLPAGLWAIERLAQRFEADVAARKSRPHWLSLRYPSHIATFAAVLVVGLLLGHPETFYFALFGMIVYAAARGFALWRDQRTQRGASGALAVLGFQLIAIGVIAAGVCAIQLLPFFEYLGESFIYGARSSGGQTPLPAASWPCLMFPNLLGNPSEPYFVSYALPAPDFDTVTMAFVGSLSLFFALLAVCVVRGRRALRLFAVMGVVWAFYAYGLFGTQSIFEWIPTLEMVPINRSQLLFHICVAVCSAFFVDRCVDGARKRSGVGALAIVALALVVLFVFRAGAASLVLESWAANAAVGARKFIPAGASDHGHAIAHVFMCGAICAALAWFARGQRVRIALSAALVVFAYFEQGQLFAHYNPTSPDRFVYPHTPSVEAARRAVAAKRGVFIGQTPLPPHVNTVYGIESLAVWDGIDIRRFELLRRRFFSEGGNWKDVTWATRRGFELFGIERVFDQDAWIDVDTLCGFVAHRPDQEFQTAPIVAGAEVAIDFVGVDERLSAVRVCFATDRHELAQPIVITVEDRDTHERLGERTLQPHEFDGVEHERVFVEIALPNLEHAATRRLQLGVRSTETASDRAWSLVARRDWGWMTSLALWRHDGNLDPPDKQWHPLFDGWTSRQGNRELDGAVVLDLHFGLQMFRESGVVGPYRMFDFESAVPRFHTVTRAFVADDEGVAWNAVQHKAFVPAQLVVLDGIDKSATNMPAETPDVNEAVEVLGEDHGKLRLRTMRAQPGWLVIAQPWYPGWKARVNGVATPIVRANFAFQAVKLGAGGNVVALDYEPDSVARGAWISLVSLGLLALWIGASWFVARRFAGRFAGRIVP